MTDPIGQIRVEANGEWILKGWSTKLPEGVHWIYASPQAALEQAGEPAPVKECLTTAADAGVTQGDIDLRSGILRYLVERLGEPCSDGDMPDDRNAELDGLIATHRLQSVAAATAAKDAEIARSREALETIERKGVDMRSDFNRSVNQSLIARAALSEAREVG